MADSTDLSALDASSGAMGKPVKLALISETELLHVLPLLYGSVSKSAERRNAPVKATPALVAVVPTAVAPRDQMTAPTRSSAPPLGALLPAPHGV